mgnify:CR=1 FL=1
MFTNYIKIALRNILKYKVYSSINIFGLAISLSVYLLVMLWITNELSFDKYNKNADRIYRTCAFGKMFNSEIQSATCPAPTGETLQKELPEVVDYTRIWDWGNRQYVVRFNDKTFVEKNWHPVDASFFRVFTTEFIYGDPKTALTQPNTVVITESTALKYFGNQSPVGKIINVNNGDNYQITGVIKDFPNESHFHFDFLSSAVSISAREKQSWMNLNSYTYIVLKKGVKQSDIENKVQNIARKYIGPQLKATAGCSLEQFEALGNKFEIKLQPLTSIHLKSHLKSELEANGEESYIYIFSAIAIAILLISCINYVNLSTAKSEKRAKEVGIRKTLGSGKSQIIWQFMCESVLTCLASVILSVIIVELILPAFNNITDKHISISLFSNLYYIPALICLGVIVGIIAGAYPAFYLSSFEPIKVLKDGINKKSRKARLRSVLVIAQFAISIVLLISTLTIFNQLNYMQNKDMGFDKTQVFIVNKINDLENVRHIMKNLLSNPNIIAVTNSNGIPSDVDNFSWFRLNGTPDATFRTMNSMTCDNEYENVYKIKMAKGRFFSAQHPSDSTAVVLNEAAANCLNLNDVDGKYLQLTGSKYYKIIGIIKDFNYTSLHDAIRPLVISLYGSNDAGKYISIKIKTTNVDETVSFIKSTIGKYSGAGKFEYGFLDKNFEKLYLDDQRASKLTTVFSILAVIIACMGLLGLIMFITEQKTKEIGIRKVLGASTSEIMSNLSGEFAKWILVANLIAWPTAYYFMNRWLQNFAFRIDLSIWTFVISGVATLVIAALTVSINVIKATTANPVESLKYE